MGRCWSLLGFIGVFEAAFVHFTSCIPKTRFQRVTPSLNIKKTVGNVRVTPSPFSLPCGGNWTIMGLDNNVMNKLILLILFILIDCNTM